MDPDLVMWLDEESFRNLVLFYKNELLEICKGTECKEVGISFKTTKSFSEKGIIINVKWGKKHRYQLTSKALKILGRHHQPHRYRKW